MKKHLTILVLFFISTIGFAQETTFKEYSYAEFFKMIEEEQDSVFILKNAKIVYDSITDKRFKKTGANVKLNPREVITINKHLEFEMVVFDKEAAFYYIHFKKNVDFKNCGITNYDSIEVDGEFSININSTSLDILTKNEKIFFTRIQNSLFNNFVDIAIYSESQSFNFSFTKNILNVSKVVLNRNKNYQSSRFYFNNISQLTFDKNNIEPGISPLSLSVDGLDWNIITGNTFTGTGSFNLEINKSELLIIKENDFEGNIILTIDDIQDNHDIDWTNFKNKTVSGNTILNNIFSSFSNVDGEVDENEIVKIFENAYNIENLIQVKSIENLSNYNSEIALKGKFLNHYKSIHNTVWANDVYIEIKDLETKRLAYLHNENPNFKSYFTWKINQFLKVFSAYGTEPARAIIFSMYVILIFALIYLFFPNSWDKHGRKRIVDRYTFFLKYMDKDAGIHEVYLEDKNDELLEFEEFKDFVESKQRKVPKIFIATALPLYKWAVSGTKLSASLLKRVDIMKGTWQDLPQSQRIWKSVLLVGAFLIAVFYDIFIKMLNALMLSINTFTTLGFGEIPIKGLPRYLAIIEGFIGWFMLTIFSVSLISQLLN